MKTFATFVLIVLCIGFYPTFVFSQDTLPYVGKMTAFDIDNAGVGFGYKRYDYEQRADRTIELWDQYNNKLLHTLKLKEDPGKISFGNFSPDDRLFLARGENGTYVWDMRTGKFLWKDHFSIETFSPDSSLIADGIGTTDDYRVNLWNIRTGKKLAPIKSLNDYQKPVAFSPDNRLLALSNDGNIQVWDMRTRKLLRTLKGNAGPFAQAHVFSSDGDLLASSTEDHNVELWNVRTGRLLHTLEGIQEWLDKLEFSSGNRLLVGLTSGNRILVWDVRTGKLLRTLTARRGTVRFDIHNFVLDGSGLAVYGSPLPNYDELHLWELGYTSGDCGTLISDALLSLEPVRIRPRITREVAAQESGISYVKGSVSADEYENTRAWSASTTVATGEIHSLILTVEFLNGDQFPTARDMVKQAARDWAKTGNVTYKFIDNTSPEGSDIRVSFFKPSIEDILIGTVPDSESLVGVLRKHYSDERTMLLVVPSEYTESKRKKFYGDALHEFGHALGFLHEHQHPDFLKYFQWVGTTELERVKTIAARYKMGYEHDPIAVTTDVKNNFLNPKNVNYSTPFDIHSVMMYNLPPEVIQVRPNAPSTIRQIFQENNATPTNSELSDTDRGLMEEIYGAQSKKARISGSVRIEGKDDESFVKVKKVGCNVSAWGVCIIPKLDWDHDVIEESHNIPSRIVVGQDTLTTEQVITVKWGGECRVEVYLSTGKIEGKTLHGVISAFLYEGTEDTTTDLEDIQCARFSLKLDKGSQGPFYLALVNSPVDRIGNSVLACYGVYDADRLPYDTPDLGSSGDEAKLYITLKAESVDATSAAPAAPSAVFVTHSSELKTTLHTPALDVTGDGQIDVNDLLLVSNYLGKVAPSTPSIDINSDGVVTIADLLSVAQHLDTASSPHAPALTGELTYAMIETWIKAAHAQNDGSLTFQQGIAKLKYLLTLVIPEETALLPNYPNPFNPETWIPYRLSKPAEVTLTIYAIDGKVVRHLALGHQPVGYYQTRRRAAYWDGRNDVGEQVASGVYFYTLTAGDFHATAKMIIAK